VFIMPKVQKDQRKPKCTSPGCGGNARFGVLAEGVTPKVCTKHKEAGMIDLLQKRCTVCRTVRARFGLLGGPATHCTICQHTEPEGTMFLAGAEMCACTPPKQAKFGAPGDSTPSRCAACRDDGMVDVSSPKCCCGKTASFGLRIGPGSVHSRRVACGTCKDDDMENLIKDGSLCTAEGCPTQASFYLVSSGSTRPTLCKFHCNTLHPGEAVASATRKSLMCQGDGCPKRAAYGPEGGNATHCATCPKKYGIPGLIDLVSPRCKGAGCKKTVARGRNEGLCSTCFAKQKTPALIVS
jgi:hypothetical protein